MNNKNCCMNDTRKKNRKEREQNGDQLPARLQVQYENHVGSLGQRSVEFCYQGPFRTLLLVVS